MALPAEVRSHHTVWLRDGDERAVPVRYAVAGEHLVCFGDKGLSSMPDGRNVTATVHAIACGRPLVTFGVTVHQMAPEHVDLGNVGELLENVIRSDGSVESATRWLRAQRNSRRMLELVP